MKNKKHLYQSICKTLPALLILVTIFAALLPITAAAQNSSESKIEIASQDIFGEKFREGRNLIDRQEWSRAADIFRAAVEKSPDHKLADAALYWLAFSYKKQKKYKEADAALDRLLERFPASSWAGDAQVMKMEIAPWVGARIASGNPENDSNQIQGKFSSELQAKLITGTLNNSGQNPALVDKLGLSGRVPLDRADEIKIAAFQSLLTADPKRAIETMGEVLKPDSKASENLQQAILRVWRNPRLFASQTLTFNITQNVGDKEFAALLRDTLVKSFQNVSSQKIRKEIIYVLANLADDQAIEQLKKLYSAENDREVKKAIINAFGNSGNLTYALYSKLDQSLKSDLNSSRAQRRKIELDTLLEIVRTEKDTELRRLAFSNLNRFQSWSASEQSVDVLKNLYDADGDEELKLSVIRALAESKQISARRKLLDIAKNDQSDKCRLEAIYSLRTSKDPEVLKFLEDLIK